MAVLSSFRTGNCLSLLLNYLLFYCKCGSHPSPLGRDIKLWFYSLSFHFFVLFNSVQVKQQLLYILLYIFFFKKHFPFKLLWLYTHTLLFFKVMKRCDRIPLIHIILILTFTYKRYWEIAFLFIFLFIYYNIYK